MALVFDTATAIIMTRALSTLLAQATDQEISDILLNHSVPRIRGYVLSASDSTGQTIFYEALKDLADSSKAGVAEMLVDAVMNEPTVSTQMRRIAAAFACAWLLMSKFSPVGSQSKASERFEDQAMK